MYHVGNDAFHGKSFKRLFQFSHDCDVLHVHLTKCQQINYFLRRFVSLLIDNGDVNGDLRLGNDVEMLTRICDSC